MADLLTFPLPFAETEQEPQAPVAMKLGAFSPGLQADASARAMALDIGRSWIVEAPAGSGKTALLMQRFLKLLAFAQIASPDEVLAITFTRKATAELRQRLFEELTAASKAEPLPGAADPFRLETRRLAEAVLRRDRDRGWGLLDRGERLNIRTIDSVCGEVARSLPVLSGSGGAREAVEDARPLYEAAAARTFAQLGGPDLQLHSALRTLLMHRDGNLQNCTSLLARMLGSREQWGRLVPLEAADLSDEVLESQVRPKLERALEQVICAALHQTLELVPPDLLEDLAGIAARSAHRTESTGKGAQIACCAGRHNPPGSQAEDLEHWLALNHLLFTSGKSWRKRLTAKELDVGIDPDDLERLKQIVEAFRENDRLQQQLCALRDLPPRCYPNEQWEVVKALFHALRGAMIELTLLFAEREQCDFVEMALAARQVLHSSQGAADLAETTGSRIRHLLVDELQDTSTSQYDLLEDLIREWGGEAETLFLVGDPKQSIYLFRQARVERFLLTFRQGRLGLIPLGQLRLLANFRTQASLVGQFNEQFSEVFPPPEHLQSPTSSRDALAAGDDVPFVAAVATRPATAEAGLHWHAHVRPGKASIAEYEADAREYPQAEARAIRRAIELWQARPLPPGRDKPWRLAVLARAREHLGSVIEEFKRVIDGKAIPYRAVDLDPLAERQEILDLLALTRALLHPGDRTAWLAVLHAPWCGLGRADLLALTGENAGAGDFAQHEGEFTVPHLVRTRSSRLSADGQALLERCWPVLSEGFTSLGRTSFSLHLQRIWRSLGGDAALTASALVNAASFFRVLREMEQEAPGRLNLSRLQARLRTLYAEPEAAAGAVELLTIHKSKGLEWDVVFVPGLHRRPASDQTELLNWIELEGNSSAAAPVVLAPIYGKGEDSDSLNSWLRSVRAKREAAELKRLFYVASTRAREELHLFGACARNKNDELCAPHRKSLLAAAWPAAEFHFRQALAAEQASATEPADTTGRLVAFPSRAAASHGLSLDLAASATDSEAAAAPPVNAQRSPLLHRLPRDFDPAARFARRWNACLPYGTVAQPREARLFERPEGSFSARAFGNVVHRFLQQVAVQLAAGSTPDRLSAEIGGWGPRLTSSLRADGLAPLLAVREAERVARALLQTLADPEGRWLLAPHAGAADERAVQSAGAEGGLRVDRTFLAGDVPLEPGRGTIWIVDYKTAEPGGRDRTEFLRGERRKYEAQLEVYAAVRRSLPDGHLPIQLALYYPLLPALLHWRSVTG